MPEHRKRLDRRDFRDLTIAVTSWAILVALLWHLAYQDAPPGALYGLDYLGLDTVLVFLIVGLFGTWRLTKVARRRKLSVAPVVPVLLDVDTLGRPVDADFGIEEAQVVHITFDNSVKRYRNSDRA